jgi:hypothetical protein
MDTPSGSLIEAIEAVVNPRTIAWTDAARRSLVESLLRAVEGHHRLPEDADELVDEFRRESYEHGYASALYGCASDEKAHKAEADALEAKLRALLGCAVSDPGTTSPGASPMKGE